MTVQLSDHKVMLVKDFDPKKWHKKGYISWKHDGIRAFYYPGESKLISRSGKQIYGMDHIVDELKDQGHVIDMELMVPGLEFNKASGIVRNHSATPQVHAQLFDVPSLDNYLLGRLAHIPGVFTAPFMHKVEHSPCPSLDFFYEMYKISLTQGYEGLMWKSAEHTYQNKRSFAWMREVPVISIDVKVTGFYEGKGKMDGILGGMYFTHKGLACKVGTLKNIDYTERRNIWENQDLYMGMTMIVEFKNYQVSGKPRQPRFKGWRDDK